MNRRELLKATGGLAAIGLGVRGLLRADETVIGQKLVPWRAGFLDLHHINTGRGNATLAIMPDGTSLLIDAGSAEQHGPAMCAARPDESRRAGEWIARYARRQLEAAGKERIDCALMTHLHGDHVGNVGAGLPEARAGGYKLTGISDVAEAMPIGKLIDRGYPDYDFPVRMTDKTTLNYSAFVKSAVSRGMTAERIRVGSNSQIAMLSGKEKYPEFAVRMIAGDGEVWTGSGETAKAHFPSLAGRKADELPSENSCSIALRMSYGRFSYFAGGDLNCDTNYGREAWHDVESPAARAAGPVSVAVCGHHGYFDANGPEFVRSLRPRVWVIQSWHASHPALSTLANLYSTELYSEPRDVFSLGLHPAAALACDRFAPQFKSSQGHVLVRVNTGGAEYSVLVLEDADENDRVKAVFGPYVS